MQHAGSTKTLPVFILLAVALLNTVGLASKGNIIKVQTRGYRNTYDSRYLLIIFSNSKTAKRFEAALRDRQKHTLTWKDTAHKKTYTLTKESMVNRFSVQGEQGSSGEESDGIQPEPMHNLLPVPNNNEEEIQGSPSSAYWKICTYNIQTVRNKTRLKRLNNFLIDEKIDILAVQETNWDGENFANTFPEYTWFGSRAKRKQSGVGFLIKTTLLEGLELETYNGKQSDDTYFLIIKKQNMRTTCLMNVYGKSNPSAAISRDQWASYTIDLQSTLARVPPNTDVIFLGDINARVGKAEHKIEERIIGRYGEKNEKRNLGKASLQCVYVLLYL